MIVFFKTIHSQAAWRHDESVEQRILLRGLSHIGATLSFDDWIAHWSLLALNEPAVTQVRLLHLFLYLTVFWN